MQLFVIHCIMVVLSSISVFKYYFSSDIMVWFFLYTVQCYGLITGADVLAAQCGGAEAADGAVHPAH